LPGRHEGRGGCRGIGIGHGLVLAKCHRRKR